MSLSQTSCTSTEHHLAALAHMSNVCFCSIPETVADYYFVKNNLMLT